METRLSTGFGESHAKVILIGEHAVVYGQPAIAIPLKTIKTTVTLKARSDNKCYLKSDYFSGELAAVPKEMYGIKHLIVAILKRQNYQLGLDISIKSQVPIARGMGSSASVAIALVRALYSFFGLALSQKILLSEANIEEIDTHKNPSGLDAATCASNIPIWLIKGKEIKPIPINLAACLLICDTGIQGQTSLAIKAVKEKLAKEPKVTNKQIAALGQLTIQAKKQLAENDPKGLGQTFNEAQKLLRALDVSSKELDYYLELAQKNHVLGAKLTGGGRGGCFICLVQNITQAHELAQKLTQAGVKKTWIEPLN